MKLTACLSRNSIRPGSHIQSRIVAQNIRSRHSVLPLFPAALHKRTNSPSKRHSSTSTTTTTTMSAKAWQDAITHRRSSYKLSPESTISDSELKSILETALEQVPSAFATFTTRMVLLVKEEHQKLWDLIISVIKPVTPEDKWESYTKGRMGGSKHSYGTILFFEDPENTRKMEQAVPTYAQHMSNWSRETAGMHQFAVWVALTNLGLGVNLQHYNPLIDEKVKNQWKVPADWTLISEMTFGKPLEPPAEKKTAMKKPLSERLFVYGSEA